MARPVEYHLDEVLDKAMNIFWEKGYENVSMAELVTYTGLNRRTMYNLFKDKDGLYRDALENYFIKMASNQLKSLKENQGKKGIELFFQAFYFEENFKGCLYTNTILEKEFVNPEAFSTVREFYQDVKIQLEKNLSEAALNGNFSGDVTAMALTLITIVQGLGVYGKFNQSKDESDLIIKNVLNMIR